MQDVSARKLLCFSLPLILLAPRASAQAQTVPTAPAASVPEVPAVPVVPVAPVVPAEPPVRATVQSDGPATIHLLGAQGLAADALCQAPCQAELSRGARYGVKSGALVSSSFGLPPASTSVQIDVTHRTQRVSGAVVLGTGVLLTAGGVAILATLLPGSQGRDDFSGAFGFGLGLPFTLTGLSLVTVGGIILGRPPSLWVYVVDTSASAGLPALPR